MSSTRSFLTGLSLLLLPSLVGAQEATQATAPATGATQTTAPTPTPEHTIAVADFTGSDPDLGRFIAETLLTDLAQSSKMHFAERSEIRHAIEELKLQSTGLVEPQQIKQLGNLVSADRIIVGSYYVLDDQIIINARLLDVESGKLMEGGAGNVTGDRTHLLSIVHRLSHEFHRRVTGYDYAIDNEGAEPSSTHFSNQNNNNASKPTPNSAPSTYRSLHGSRTEASPQTTTRQSDNSGYRVQEQAPAQQQPDYTPYTLPQSDPPPPRVYQPIVMQESSLLYPVNYPNPSRQVFRLHTSSTRSAYSYGIHFVQPRIVFPQPTSRRRPLR